VLENVCCFDNICYLNKMQWGRVAWRRRRAAMRSMIAGGRGTMRCHNLNTHLLPPNWKLFVTAWVDNKPVHVLHTWPTFQDVCERNCKQAGGQRYSKKLIPRPTVCKIYNKTMGGTDLADFFLAAYATNHRAKRWQPRILFHCIQLAVMNAHILYGDKKGLQKGSFRLLDFVELLLQEIAPKPAPTSQPSCYMPSAVLSTRNRSWWNAHVQLRTQGQHFPDAFSQPRSARAEIPRQDPRRRCIYCQDKYVATFCKQCGVFLCLGRCFHEFHTLHDLQMPSKIDDNSTPSSASDSD
jgi:Transposase IS4